MLPTAGARSSVRPLSDSGTGLRLLDQRFVCPWNLAIRWPAVAQHCPVAAIIFGREWHETLDFAHNGSCRGKDIVEMEWSSSRFDL
jgi:hypothetical protein